MDLSSILAVGMEESMSPKEESKTVPVQKVNRLDDEVRETVEALSTIIHHTLVEIYNKGKAVGYEEARKRVMMAFGGELPPEEVAPNVTEEDLEDFKIPEDAVGEEIPLDDDDEESDEKEESKENNVSKHSKNATKSETVEIPKEEESAIKTVGEELLEKETIKKNTVPLEEKTDIEAADSTEYTSEEVEWDEPYTPQEGNKIEPTADLVYNELSADAFSAIEKSTSKKEVTDIPVTEEEKEDKAEKLFSEAKIKQKEMVENGEYVYQEEEEEKVKAKPLSNPNFWNSISKL